MSDNEATLVVIEVRDRHVPLTDAVASYLFNSQLVTLPDGSQETDAQYFNRDPYSRSMRCAENRGPIVAIACFIIAIQRRGRPLSSRS